MEAGIEEQKETHWQINSGSQFCHYPKPPVVLLPKQTQALIMTVVKLVPEEKRTKILLWGKARHNHTSNTKSSVSNFGAIAKDMWVHQCRTSSEAESVCSTAWCMLWSLKRLYNKCQENWMIRRSRRALFNKYLGHHWVNSLTG